MACSIPCSALGGEVHHCRRDTESTQVWRYWRPAVRTDRLATCRPRSKSVRGLRVRDTPVASASNHKLANITAVCLQGGTIRGSINLPAQTLYPAIPTLYSVFNAADVRKVIWYCGELESRYACAACDTALTRWLRLVSRSRKSRRCVVQ